MFHPVIKASVVGSLFFMAGCSSGGDDDAAPGGDAGLYSCGTTITADPANNYKFFSELTIDVTKVKPSTELFFDWSAVKTDFLGHPIDMATIGMVEIGLWNMDLDTFEQGLNDDTLAQSDLAIIATILPNPAHPTTGSIYDLTESGEPVERTDIDKYLDINVYGPPGHVYTAMVADGTELGKGTRMIQGFQLDAASMNTMVNVTDTSTHLEMSADLHSLKSPGIPVNTPTAVVDWTNMKTTAAGLPFDPQRITKLRVGRYSITPTEMEMKETFLNLDTKADVMYTSVVKAGTSISLDKAKDAAGNVFPGIDDSHTWIVALNCDECANPAPWYLSVIKPCKP